MPGIRIGPAFVGGGSESITLNELSDVTITSASDNDILGYDLASGQWINQTATQLGLDDRYLLRSNNLSDLTNAATARTNLSVYSISQVDTLLATKQPLDSTLTALAAYNTNGILTQTAADTFTGRTITGTSNRIDITNGNGVSGNPTIDISSTYVGQSSITTLGTITTGVWNGTDIAIADGGTGASDAATARTNLGLVAGGAGDIWVEKAGDTMTGALVINTTGIALTVGASGAFTPVGAPSAEFVLSESVNAVTGMEFRNLNTGTTADSRFAVSDTTDTYLAFAMPSTGNTQSTIFGLARASNAFMFTSSSGTPRGLGIGTFGSTNLTLGTNNAAAITVDTSQRVVLNASTATLTVGSSTAATTEVYSSGITFTNTSGTRKVFDAAGTSLAPTANTSAQLQAVNAEAVINTTGSGFNFTNTSAGGLGFQGKVTVNGTGGNVVAARAGNFLIANNGTGTDIDTAITVAILASQTVGVGATIQEACGLLAANQTVGATSNINFLLGTTTIPAGNFSIYNASGYVNYFNGDVGIGTTSPDYDLHVSRASATMGVEATSGGVNMTADAIEGNANFNFNSKSSSTGTGNQGQFNFNAYVDGSSGDGIAKARWILLKTSTQETGVSNAGSNFNLLRRQDNGNSLGNPVITCERSTGYVGINRTEASAEYQLDVFGTMRIDGNNLPGTLTLRRNDGTVTAAESLGKIEFVTNDATVTTDPIAAYIEVTAFAAYTTNAAPADMRIFIMDSTAGGSALERVRINPNEMVINDTGLSVDFRVEGDTDANLIVGDASADTVIVGAATVSDSAKFYVSGKISTSGEMEINGALNHDGTTVGFYGVAPVTRPSAYTITNGTLDRSYNANATTVDELADVIYTMWTDLSSQGLLQ